MNGETQVSRTTVDEWAWDPATNALPASVDVAIIGGGIVGCCAAWFLAREGISVGLFEKGRIAGEQSGRNWGWVRQQGRSPVELPMMMRSRRLWPELQRELGEDVGFRQGGCMYLAATQAQLDEIGPWLVVAREHGLDTRLLTRSELGGVLRGDLTKWAGALYTASDGRAEPNRAAPAVARGARRAGARVITGCAVRGLQTAAGRVHGIVTERGVVNARSVVCAAGAWTRLFCRALGITVPQLLVLGTVARAAPSEAILEGEAWAPTLGIRRRADGGHTIAHGASFLHRLTPDTLRFATKFIGLYRGTHSMRVRAGAEFFRALAAPARWDLDAPSPFERQRMLDPAPEPGVLRQVRGELRQWFPEIADVPFVETWAGMIEASPDALPIICESDRLPGFHVATGFSGHGFGIGPGAGRFVADLVLGKADAAELAAFRLDRYFDGTPIRPGPSL